MAGGKPTVTDAEGNIYGRKHIIWRPEDKMNIVKWYDDFTADEFIKEYLKDHPQIHLITDKKLYAIVNSMKRKGEWDRLVSKIDKAYSDISKCVKCSFSKICKYFESVNNLKRDLPDGILLNVSSCVFRNKEK